MGSRNIEWVCDEPLTHSFHWNTSHPSKTRSWTKWQCRWLSHIHLPYSTARQKWLPGRDKAFSCIAFVERISLVVSFDLWPYLGLSRLKACFLNLNVPFASIKQLAIRSTPSLRQFPRYFIDDCVSRFVIQKSRQFTVLISSKLLQGRLEAVLKDFLLFNWVNT